MTREDWMREYRRVDEIVIKSSEALRVLDQEGKTKNAVTLKLIYWLAVAVWHLLDAKIKGEVER